MNEKLKNKLWIALAVVMIAVFAVIALLNPAPEHIEDTNGPSNYSLETITKADIAAAKMGCRGGLSKSESGIQLGPIGISSGIKYSCNKFTGVYLLHSSHYFKGSDIFVDLYDYRVDSGNFGFYIVLDGEVIGQAEPDEFGHASFLCENIEEGGTVEFVIAGESADFSFVTTEEYLY